MNLPTQTALVEWVPLLNEQETMYSVYRLDVAIKLHSGCERMKDLRLISSHKDYGEAYEFCELLAEAFQLPIQDLSGDRAGIYD